MVAPIRYPRTLPPPLSPDNYGDSNGETRAFFQAEIGHPRSRQQFRTTPRFFDVKFRYTQTEFDLFHDWFYGSVKQGVSRFDIQLIDGDEDDLLWFTCRIIGGFELDVDSSFNYWVTVKLRSIEEPFEDRPESTDDLAGINSVEAFNTGSLEIAVHLYTTVDAQATNTGRMGDLLMRGLSDGVANNTGRFMPPGFIMGLSDAQATNTGELDASGFRVTRDSDIRVTHSGDRRIVYED